MEQAQAFDVANFQVKYSDRQNTTVNTMRVAYLICPSEVNPEPFSPAYQVGTYAWNQGPWLTWQGYDVRTKHTGMFGINWSRKLAEVRDGTSNTVVASEGKAHQPSLRSCGSIPGLTPAVPTPDVARQIIQAAFGVCRSNRDPGKTRWTNFNSYYSGLTFTFPPNPRTTAGPAQVDFDLITVDENDGAPTYAAVSARSYHPGGVNALFADGSVRFVKDTIEWTTWRALGSVNGGEVISADKF
jgi:prepilin-type processing-associated H-X9-DG protein